MISLSTIVFNCMSQDREVDGEIELVILASDGLWDVVPNEVIISVAFDVLIFSFL